MANYLVLGQSCEPVLPAAPVVDVYRMTVMLPLEATLGDITSRLILPPHIQLRKDGDNRRLVTVFDEQGGLRVDTLADGEGDSLFTSAVTEVNDVDPYEVVAAGSVAVNGEPMALKLTPHATAALLGGHSARVSTGRGHAPAFLVAPPG